MLNENVLNGKTSCHLIDLYVSVLCVRDDGLHTK